MALLIIDAASNATCANKYQCCSDCTDKEHINDSLQTERRKVEEKSRRKLLSITGATVYRTNRGFSDDDEEIFNTTDALRKSKTNEKSTFQSTFTSLRMHFHLNI